MRCLSDTLSGSSIISTWLNPLTKTPPARLKFAWQTLHSRQRQRQGAHAGIRPTAALVASKSVPADAVAGRCSARILSCSLTPLELPLSGQKSRAAEHGIRHARRQHHVRATCQ
jgi:hypothetical protein